MAELEYKGIKVGGSKLILIVPLVGTIIGGLWAGFEFWKDYEILRDKVQNYTSPDLSGYDKRIAVMNEQFTILKTQSEYFSKQIELYEGQIMMVTDIGDEHYQSIKDLKNSMREDLSRQEKVTDSIEDDMAEIEDKTRDMIDIAEERFSNKRDSLVNDYDQKADSLRTSVDTKLTDLENRLTKKMEVMKDELNTKLQRSLDNPLANN